MADKLTMREALELVRDCSSQEWQQPDGRRMGATDNSGRRMWFITEDVMLIVRELLAAPPQRRVTADQIERAGRRVLCGAPVAGVNADAPKLPPMGSASQSACGCYSYESEGVKTEHWCEKHSPFGSSHELKQGGA